MWGVLEVGKFLYHTAQDSSECIENTTQTATHFTKAVEIISEMAVDSLNYVRQHPTLGVMTVAGVGASYATYKLAHSYFSGSGSSVNQNLEKKITDLNHGIQLEYHEMMEMMDKLKEEMIEEREEQKKELKKARKELKKQKKLNDQLTQLLAVTSKELALLKEGKTPHSMEDDKTTPLLEIPLANIPCFEDKIQNA